MSKPSSQKKTYAERLKDPRWINLRNEILKERGILCQSPGCDGTSQRFEVHHGFYVWHLEPWEYEKETLWVLCQNCHDKAHYSQAVVHRQFALKGPGTWDLDAQSIENAAEMDEQAQLDAMHAELQRAEQEQADALWSLNSGYTVTIYQSPDAPNSAAVYIAERLEHDFPGINVSVTASTPDCNFEIYGDTAHVVPDDDQMSVIQNWLTEMCSRYGQ